MSNWFEKVYEVVKTIPRGKVMSYGQVAGIVGLKNPRVVGFALHVNKTSAVPCHRVVTKLGKLSDSFAFGGSSEHRFRLEQEGVEFDEEGLVKPEFFVRF